MVNRLHTDVTPKGHVSHESLIANIPPIHAEEGAAHYVSAVFLRHHGCGFVGDGAPCIFSQVGRVVRNGGTSAAHVDVGASRVCCRLLSRCLRGPGCSLDLLLIRLLPPPTDDAASASRAEVVDGDDTVKH